MVFPGGSSGKDHFFSMKIAREAYHGFTIIYKYNIIVLHMNIYLIICKRYHMEGGGAV
ncbi:hypothetical protein JCM10914A_24270 [Paenibacillus sp. JCM 10914]